MTQWHNQFWQKVVVVRIPGDTNSGSKVMLVVSCIVTMPKLLESPAALTCCRIRAPRVEKQVPDYDKTFTTY